MADDLGSTLGILPQMVRNETPSIPNRSKNLSRIVDCIAEFAIFRQLALQVLEGPGVLGAPDLERLSKSSRSGE